MPPVAAFFASAFASVSAAVVALKATALGAFALQLGTSLLLSAVAARLAPKPKLTDRTTSIRVPVGAREMVYGTVRKGGTIVFLHTTGSKKEFLHIVIVLAAHRVQQIGAVYFDGVMAVNASGTPQGRWGGIGLSTRISQIEKALGTQTGNPFPQLAAAAPTKWTSAHRLLGCAAISMRLHYNQDAFPNGIPNISVDVVGKNNILDPRTGLRGYTNNAALCLADYMSDAAYGVGATIGAETGVDSLSLIEAANICDEAVPLAGGGTEPRYTANGILSLSVPPREAIESMLTAMAGHVAYRGSQWYILAGAYRPPATTFGPGDFDEKGVTVSTRMSMRENFNGVRGQFVSPENDWQPDDFPAYRSAVYVAEDGGEERWKDINLPFTTSSATAQRLAKIELEKTRRQLTVSFSGKLQLYRATAGDTVNFSFPAWGIENKPFDVRSVQFSGDGSDGARLEVVLRETSPLVYDWSATEQQIYAAAPRTDLPSAFDIEPPGTPVIVEESYITRDGTGVKARAIITWEEAATAFVSSYRVRARRLADLDGNPVPDQTIELPNTQNTRQELQDVQPGLWRFEVRSVSPLGVLSAWALREQSILGLTAPPVQLQGLGLQSTGGLAVLTWQQSTDLDVRIGGRIVIRHSPSEDPSWPNSTSLAEVPGSDGIAVVALKPGTYLVRARDNSGNYGPIASIVTDGETALSFTNTGVLQEDPTFPGTKTNAEVDGTSLRLTDVSLPGLYEFGTFLDFGSARLLRLRSLVRVAALSLAGTIDERLELIDTWADFDDTDGAETDVVVEFRATLDNPAFSPVWTDWRRVDSAEIQARAVQARARLISESPDFNVLVTQLRLIADEVA
jgi:hypothetical protein